MRVFCPQHKTGFLTPRRNPIRCENRGHVLGEFIFHGDAKTVPEVLWQYCCNCEHFYPIEGDQSTSGRCPACARPISRLYVCDGCFTFSVDSSTPVQTKNFTLTSDGVPQPSCPGCFQERSGDLHEHECDPLGAPFISALSACPICLEHLDVGPAFPSSAAQYLGKTRAANKINVAFDYATGLFLPVGNGEFVLVSGTKTSRPFVLPRSTRFATRNDFYELYQDYYHCPNVNAGELHIIEPAFVESVGDGWKLQSMGVLEIVSTQPQPGVLLSNVPSETEFTIRERSPLFRATLIEESPTATKESPSPPTGRSPTVTCSQCRSPVADRYAFCWNCGHATKGNADASKQVDDTTTFAQRIFATEDESTGQQHVSDSQRPIFSWAASQPSGASSTSSRLKLIAIVVIGFVLVTLGLVLLKGPAAQWGRPAEAQLTSSLPATADIARVEPTTVAIDETHAHTRPTTNSAQHELWKLREKLIGASPSDRAAVLQLFASTEERFPDDYRFPYERAKLAINARETRSHHEAFNALSLAAEKAIDADKAEEMLKALQADSIGDFHKLSRGHREWTQLVEALKRKDATLLTAKEHL